MKKLISLLLATLLSTSMLAACLPETPADETTVATTPSTAIDETEAPTTITTHTTETTVDRETSETEETEPDTTSADMTEPGVTDTTDGVTGETDLDFESFNDLLLQLKVTKNPDGSAEIYLPSALVTEDTLADLESGEGEFDIATYAINEDGSAILYMDREQHQDFLDDLRDELDDTFDELKEIFPSYKDIEYSDDMRKVTLLVDKETWSEDTTIALLGLGMSSFFYQIYDGVPMDDIEYEIIVVDEDTGEVLYSMDNDE